MPSSSTTQSEAARLSQEAYKAAKANLDTIMYNMSQKTAALFYEAVNEARVNVNIKGEEAMAEAVQKLAMQGIYASSHTDKNGRGYRVPADVAVRQAVYTSGRQRFNDQVLAVAQRTGQDLIEVSGTKNCRPSHEFMNEKIFSLSGTDFRYPKWMPEINDRLHDFNCGHSLAIYHESLGRVFKDPLEGTGYTLEEARKAVSKQRAYENQIRKQKRVVEALNAAGLDASEANAKLNATRHRLRQHIEANSKILHRERHREQLYDSAARMKKAKRVVPPPAPKKPSAPKVASVSGNALEKAVQTVAAKGAGATVVVEAGVTQYNSIGATDAYGSYKKRRKNEIWLGTQEYAIVNSVIEERYDRHYKGAKYATVIAETVGGAYIYDFEIVERGVYIFTKKRKIK